MDRAIKEGEEKEKKFQNITDEISYYRTKYKKYKEKFIFYRDAQTKLRGEFSELLNKHENLKDELKSEIIVRKKFEGKVIDYMKYDQVRDIEKYREGDKKEDNFKINNYEKDLFRVELLSPKKTNENDKNNNIENENDYFERHSGASLFTDNNFLRSSDINKQSYNNSITSSSFDNNININTQDITLPEQTIQTSNKLNFNTNIKPNSNTVIQSDTNLTSSNLKERTLKEITNKFDIEKLKRSLTVDFIEFEKDTISIRRKMVTREDKLTKLEKVLKIWIEISDNFRKSIDNVSNSMGIFVDNFVQEPLDIFEECPDLISLIYTLQSVITDMIVQFKIFSVSIENSFTNQIKIFLNLSIQELKESKLSVIKHTEEFNYVSSKFLSTKKSYIKESMKDNYLSQYKLLEFTRYDFISKINTSLLFTKIDLPEKISLLIYAFMSLFRQGNETLHKIEYNVNANLEKVSVKHKEKEKIIEEIKINKKDLIKSFDKVNSSIETKEGFLYVKLKDSNEYFKKRYFKVHNGNLVYFKLKKGTDGVDMSNYFILCNLILTNAKRNEKEYDFPFCFELISANNKKSFILQGETEKEAEEWVCAIRNAIANSISHYQNDSSPKKMNRENLNEFASYNNSDSFTEKDKKENTIDKLITINKCTDCESDSPTWCSINWLCLICIDCSGVHRSLGVQITKIRSLRLDNLEPELIELIDIMGQDKINAVLEAGVKSYEKPKYNSMYNEKEVYITNKYKFKKFFKIPSLIMSTNNKSGIKGEMSGSNSYSTAIFKFIDSESLINIYHLLKLDLCEINKLYECEKDKYSFLHHSAKKGKINIFKLLILLGADIQILDGKNLKPIDYATIYKNVFNYFLFNI